jgi:hypothetical protein
MVRQKKTGRAFSGGSFKTPILCVAFILLLFSSTIRAYDIKSGINKIDVADRGKIITLHLKNCTEEEASDVFAYILKNNALEIIGMDSSHERLDRVDDNDNGVLDADEVDRTVKSPGQKCRLIFDHAIAPSPRRGNSTGLTVTFNTNPGPGTKLGVLFSIKLDNEHLNILAGQTIGKEVPGSTLVPKGTNSGYIRITNKTGGLVKGIHFRVKGNTIKKILPVKKFVKSQVKKIGGYARIDLDPPLPDGESIGIYFWLDRPAADDSTTLMSSDKEPQYWPSPKIVFPTTAISGGTITGTVTFPEYDKPLPGIYVSTGTGGIPEKTDDGGGFELDVPAGSSLTVTTVGLPGKTEAKIIPEDELDFPLSPPEFIKPGKFYTIIGNYPIIKYRAGEYGESYRNPDARSVSRDGSKAITMLVAPIGTSLGKGKWIMTDARGINREFESYIYNVRSGINKKDLESGQKADAEYNFDFGRTMAGRTLWIQIKTTGAVNLLGRPGLRPFTTDSYGRAKVKFKVRAITGSGGARLPFSIKHTIYTSRR